jgi:hexosaminidase
MKLSKVLKIFFLVLTSLGAKGHNSAELLLLPTPKSVEWKGEWIKRGFEFNIEKILLSPDSVSFLKLIPQKMESEAYELNILVENGKTVVEVVYGDEAGKRYGITTFLQLYNLRDGFLPVVQIEDKPTFAWRGVHLDVSRHFHSAENIKKMLAIMGMFKLNKFHWHLVDDQGWRIHIKQFPKLTEMGGFRVPRDGIKWNERKAASKDEKASYGGFYTQEEIKEVVQFAEQLGIEVIPEIELPAHVSSAIAAYPELSCSPDTISVPTGGIWPTKNLYCPSKPFVWEFLFGVLDEVSELFPSKWIHIGGDEAHYSQWEADSSISFQMKALGLKSHADLQAWMNQKVGNYLRPKGKILIGWDEIIELSEQVGAPKDAAVMVWRDSKWAFEAAKKGHQVILSPENFLYFDHYQDLGPSEPEAIGNYTSLKDVWEYKPFEQIRTKSNQKKLTQEIKSRILGIQANLWTEYMPTWKQVEYMLFPRFFALAERSWQGEVQLETESAEKSWKEFVSKVHFYRLMLEGVVYSLGHEIKPELTLKAVSGGVELSIDSSQYEFLSQFGKVKFWKSTKAIDLESKNLDLSIDTNEFIDFNDSSKVVLDKTTRVKAFVVFNGSKTLLNSFVEFKKPLNSIVSSKPFDKLVNAHKAVGGIVNVTPSPIEKFNKKGVLANGLKGSLNFSDGEWVGIEQDDFSVEIDVSQLKDWSLLKFGFLNDPVSWIFIPKSYEVYATDSKGITKLMSQVSYEELWKGKTDFEKRIVYPSLEFEKGNDIQKIMIKVKAMSKCPKGHSGEGGKAWTFIDEIVVL